MLKSFVKSAALIVALGGGAAHADTFDFSYTFSDGQSLSGTLQGVLNGSLVTGVSDVSVIFNGSAYAGTLYAGAFSPSIGNTPSSWNYAGNAAVVSTTASQNNFIFANSNDPQGNNVTNYFYFVNGSTPSGTGSTEVYAVNTNTNDIDLDNVALGTGTGTWTLTDVSAVPLPAALPLLLSGFGVLGFAARRRRAAAV